MINREQFVKQSPEIIEAMKVLIKNFDSLGLKNNIRMSIKGDDGVEHEVTYLRTIERVCVAQKGKEKAFGMALSEAWTIERFEIPIEINIGD